LVYIGIFFSGQGLDESFSLGPNLILTRTGDGLIGALPRPNPAALYSACVSFAIFGVLLIVKIRRHFDGQVFWTFVLLNGGLQLTLAIWVFSGARLLHGGAPSPSTLIGAFVVTASLAMLIRLRRRARRAAAALE
jgi:prolipoprotein diacylglyceryltransferase